MANQGANNVVATAIAVANTDTVYTNSQEIRVGEQFGLWVQLATSGSPNVKIEIEQSYVLPTTEGSSDSNYVTPDGVASISTLTDKNAHIFGIPLRPMRYFRLKLTGISANPSDTTAKLILFVQQPNN